MTYWVIVNHKKHNIINICINIQGILIRPATSCIRSEFMLEATQSIAILAYAPRSFIIPDSQGDAPLRIKIDAESRPAGQHRQLKKMTQFLVYTLNYFRQNSGTTNIITVNISNLPSSMHQISSHLPKMGIWA